MSIISVEEFKQKTVSGLSHQEKKYQNKVLSSGPVFSKTNKQLAISYCQDYLQKKRICFVVEEKHYFQIWYEEYSLTVDATNETNSTSQENHPSIKHNLDLQEEVMVDRVFVDRCQQILIQLIGPIATIICKQAFAQNPNIEQSKFIDFIAKQIPDSQKAQEFSQKIQK